MIRKKYPITAQLRNGTNRQYNQPGEIWFDVAHLSHTDRDTVAIDDLKFTGFSHGDLHAIFIEKQYDMLSVKGKVVLDIGANIGDSAIYFVKRGAKRVYAVEPNQVLYQLARKNIALNSMSHRIVPIFAGCSSDPSTDLFPPFLSLEELYRSCDFPPEVLKVDCEGCEYEIIMNAEDALLCSFDGILIEYHSGYRCLIRKLEDSGLIAKRVSGPTYVPQGGRQADLVTRFSNVGSKLKVSCCGSLYIGQILAENKFLRKD